MGHSGTNGRLTSLAGTAFGLVPVPDPRGAGTNPEGSGLVDVELVHPGRLVCVLGRRVTASALAQLASAYRQAASDARPETTVPTLVIPGCGISVEFVASDDLSVTVACSVVEALGDEVPENDTLVLEVLRTSLDDASAQLVAWAEILGAPRERLVAWACGGCGTTGEDVAGSIAALRCVSCGEPVTAMH